MEWGNIKKNEGLWGSIKDFVKVWITFTFKSGLRIIGIPGIFGLVHRLVSTQVARLFDNRWNGLWFLSCNVCMRRPTKWLNRSICLIQNVIYLLWSSLETHLIVLSSSHIRKGYIFFKLGRDLWIVEHMLQLVNIIFRTMTLYQRLFSTRYFDSILTKLLTDCNRNLSSEFYKIYSQAFVKSLIFFNERSIKVYWADLIYYVDVPLIKLKFTYTNKN